MQEPMVERVKAHLGAFCARDWDAYGAGLAPDAVYVEAATGRTARGADAYVEAVKDWMGAFPDMGVTFERALPLLPADGEEMCT